MCVCECVCVYVRCGETRKEIMKRKEEILRKGNKGNTMCIRKQNATLYRKEGSKGSRGKIEARGNE